MRGAHRAPLRQLSAVEFGDSFADGSADELLHLGRGDARPERELDQRTANFPSGEQRILTQYLLYLLSRGLPLSQPLCGCPGGDDPFCHSLFSLVGGNQFGALPLTAVHIVTHYYLICQHNKENPCGN